MQVYDIQRKQIILGQEISRNAETAVYRVENNNMFVVKLYHTPSDELERKLAWMVANQPYDPNQTCGHTSIAWPRWLIFHKNGDWIGYVTDYIGNAKKLREVFDPELRVRNGFDLRYVYRAARYIAGSLHAIHTLGSIVGSLNPNDILVTASARITIIATDTFQIEEHRKNETVLYPCREGKATYTPPELIGKKGKDLICRPEHDYFALAVIIFQLMMEGHHPFDGVWKGDGDPPSLDERIIQGIFPYANPSHPSLVPPPGVSLNALPSTLVDLFQRCFGEGLANPTLRPTAFEWEQALDIAERRLTMCANGHAYSDHVGVCPICGAGPADEKVARRYAAMNPEPAAVCEPIKPLQAKLQQPWVLPLIMGVVIIVVAVILIGGKQFFMGA